MSVRSTTQRHAGPTKRGDPAALIVPLSTLRIDAAKPPVAGTSSARHVISWTVHDPELSDSLLVAGDLSWEDWQASGWLSIVKQGPHRTVYRLVRPHETTVYLKRFSSPSWRDWVANWLRGSRARLERDAALVIAELGLPTISPALLGETTFNRWGFELVGDSYLATPEIPNSQPLDEYVTDSAWQLPPGRQVEFRQWLARSLGEIAGRLHAAGVLHPDLHAGNLLVTGAGPTTWVLWLIDLHAVEKRLGLPVPVRDRNLAELAGFFAGRMTRADRCRFWRSYRAASLVEDRPATHFEELQARRRIETALQTGLLRGRLRTDAAWSRGNRHVRNLETPAAACRGLARLDPETLRAWREAPDEWADKRRIRWCKRSNRREVSQLAGTDLNLLGGVYVKRIVRMGWLARVVDTFRTPIVRHAWLVGLELRRRGIATPEPLAYLVRRDGAGLFAPTRQYLLTAGLPNTMTLESRLATPCGDLPTRLQLSAWRDQMADAVRELHASGYDHRDLKFANWLVAADSSPDLVDRDLWLLDLDAVRRRPGWWSRWVGTAVLSKSRRVQNLSRIAVSARCHSQLTWADCLRFLKRYLGAEERSDWRTWWREISLRVAAKTSQNAQRGRPLS
jgi:tRNA A-37 threonylcarbamoyl transferase component Bud32